MNSCETDSDQCVCGWVYVCVCGCVCVYVGRCAFGSLVVEGFDELGASRDVTLWRREKRP